MSEDIDVMRLKPRALSEEDKADINSIKCMGNSLYRFLECLGECREISLAKTKLEEAVMWAVKSITD